MPRTWCKNCGCGNIGSWDNYCKSCGTKDPARGNGEYPDMTKEVSS